MSGPARPGSKNVVGDAALLKSLRRRAALAMLCALACGTGAARLVASSFPSPNSQTVSESNASRDTIAQGEGAAARESTTSSGSARTADRGEPQRLSSKGRKEIFERIWRE